MVKNSITVDAAFQYFFSSINMVKCILRIKKYEHLAVLIQHNWLLPSVYLLGWAGRRGCKPTEWRGSTGHVSS